MKGTPMCKFDYSSNDRGFTLIELLVSMGIMAVLTGMAAFNFNQSRIRARDVQRKSDMSQLQKGLELYRNDNNSYPSSDMQNKLLAGGYTKVTFHDPRESEWVIYQYKPGVNNKSYYMMTCLENTADSTKATDTNLCKLFTTEIVDPCSCGHTSGTRTGVMYIVTNP